MRKKDLGLNQVGPRKSVEEIHGARKRKEIVFGGEVL